MNISRWGVLGVAVCVSLAGAASVTSGQTIYNANCAGCHGAQAQGKVGPKLAGDAANWSYALFSRALLKGLDDHGRPLKAPMPVWGKVGLKGDAGKPPTPTEIKAIQAYLKTFK